MARSIYIWGFPDTATSRWPADLMPAPVAPSDDWPEDAPIVVHVNAASQFAEQVASRLPAGGSLPRAILYLPPGTESPADLAAFFDDRVEEGDWETLRDLTECPRLFESSELAEDLPASFVQAIHRPIPDLPVESLPVPAEWRQHLAECRLCRVAFDHALEERWIQQRLLRCPPIARLAAVARGEPDSMLDVHLKECAFCTTQLAGLRRDFAPAPIWQRVPLLRAASAAADIPSELKENVREAIDVLEAAASGMLPAARRILSAFIYGGAQQRLAPIVATARRERRDVAGLDTGAVPGKVVVDLLHENWVWSIQVEAAVDDDVVRISSVHDQEGNSMSHFRVELRLEAGDLPVWQSTAKDGEVEIPLEVLESMVEAGGSLVIVKPPDPPSRPSDS